MEYLDIYDESGNYLGKEDRKIVHRDALWHKTVHCWLYDKDGNVFFQRRRDKGTLYTTASGHLQAGETIEEGFAREIQEEIGAYIDYKKTIKVNVVNFVMDREEPDGSVFRDRAFANIYVCEFDGKYEEFEYDEAELDGLVKVNAEDTLKILTNESGSVKGVEIKRVDGKITSYDKTINFDDFLVNKGETALGKYGEVLNKIIELTK